MDLKWPDTQDKLVGEITDRSLLETSLVVAWGGTAEVLGVVVRDSLGGPYNLCIVGEPELIANVLMCFFIRIDSLLVLLLSLLGINMNIFMTQGLRLNYGIIDITAKCY